MNYIDDNMIDGKSAKAIAESLKINNSIHLLNLSNLLNII